MKSLSTLYDGRVSSDRSSQKRESHRLLHAIHWSQFVGCFIYYEPKVKFMRIYNHTGHYKK